MGVHRYGKSILMRAQTRSTFGACQAVRKPVNSVTDFLGQL